MAVLLLSIGLSVMIYIVYDARLYYKKKTFRKDKDDPIDFT